MDGKKHWNWKGGKIGYISIHSWNNKHYPKTGICITCGNKKKTVWALIHGNIHKRGTENYRELCQSCHIKYDRTEEWNKKSLQALSKTYAHTHRIKPKNCICGKEFIPRRKTTTYCSNSCSAEHRDKKSYERTRGKNGKFIA